MSVPKGESRMIFDEKFRANWKHYSFQSFLATLVLFIILIVLKLQNAVITASIGATAFIIFAMPDNITASPRNVIGGHALGLFFGALCALIPHTLWVQSALVYSMAVGLSIFAMVVLDMEHPPAAGTALGMAISGATWSVAGALIFSTITLSLIHKIFLGRLKNLV